MPASGNDNANANPTNINFTIKGKKLYIPVVTLSVRDNQKIWKLLSKGFEKSVYLNEYKTKSENKNMANEYRYFLESNFVGVSRLFVLVYSNQDDITKRFKTRRHYLPKEIVNNYNVIINVKNVYN